MKKLSVLGLPFIMAATPLCAQTIGPKQDVEEPAQAPQTILRSEARIAPDSEAFLLKEPPKDTPFVKRSGRILFPLTSTEPGDLTVSFSVVKATKTEAERAWNDRLPRDRVRTPVFAGLTFSTEF